MSNLYRDYQEYAEECLRWAAESDTDRQKAFFMGIADAWMQAARRAEDVLVPEPNPACDED